MLRAILRAVEIAGSQSRLARAVGVTPQAVQRWVKLGYVSHTMVLPVERATGVSRYELRPDIYPQDTPALTNSLPHPELPPNADRRLEARESPAPSRTAEPSAKP